MCGICGIIRFDQQAVAEHDLKIMMQAMKHRGPDDEGTFIDQNVALGFVRLSILDLSAAGHQPFISENKQFIIVFNGEVYNYIELREILFKKGYKFRSNTDTEVILNSYMEWGEACLDHFNGMWAFAIYDKQNKTLFISRDRFGIKPFYFYKDNNTFIFASDIPSLLKILPIQPQPNEKIIYEFLLTNRTNHTQETFFKNIFKLQHGHKLLIHVNNGNFEEKTWYKLNEKKVDGFTNAEEFKNALIDSIKIQLRSDVPVGLCLSGGLDSSSIGATISKTFNRNDIHSFSAIYGKGEIGDESEFIDEFKGYIDNIHFTHPTADSLLNDLDSFITALSEPVPGTSEYAEYKVMELAHKHCTVLLNGQGVDEYMAGYHYLIGFYYKHCFRNLKWGRLLNDIYQYRKIHHSIYPFKTSVFYMLPSWLKEKILFKSNDYISKEFASYQSKQNEISIVEQLYNSKSLHQAFIDHYQYKFEHHLLWADKAGMKFSLETRFPFLDHRIVEKMMNTNEKFIYKNGITKIILREAMQGILPEKIRMRMDKVGYETPEDKWFRTEKCKNLFASVFNSDSIKNREFFNHLKVKELFENHQKGQNNGKELWKIFHLELWMNKYFK